MTQDLLETCIVSEPCTYEQIFRNRVFHHVLNHRDALGYPKGCKSFPYMVCTNDLCTIAIEFMQLVTKHKLVDVMKDIPTVLDLLIDSYGEKQSGLWHSMDKDVFVQMRSKIDRVLQVNL